VNNALNAASRWRIELAAEVAEFYARHQDVRMIVLGGSPSRGLSDSYSDLDMVVYWESIDIAWLEDVPLHSLGRDRWFFRKMGESAACLESYYFGTLKVDIGHTAMREWEQWTSKVLDDYDTEPGLQGTISGFLDSITLYGESLVEEWKNRLRPYPEELAKRMVKQHLRFYVRGCLLNQGFQRDDLLFYYDGLCLMFKNVIGILAGINRVYFSLDEPRWISYELERMPIRPANTWERMRRALQSPGPEAIDILEGLINDVMDLVDEHMPDMNVAEIRRRYEKGVEACDEKPYLNRSQESP
jgi:hypothetical protein